MWNAQAHRAGGLLAGLQPAGTHRTRSRSRGRSSVRRETPACEARGTTTEREGSADKRGGLLGLLSGGRRDGSNGAATRRPRGAASVDEAAERIRLLAREVAELSNGADLAAQRAQEPQVTELRSQLQTIQSELIKLNSKAAEAGVGNPEETLSLLRMPEPLREAIHAAPEVTPLPSVVDEPLPVTLPSVTAPPSQELPGEEVKPEGTGREVLLQAFNWESWKQGWWRKMGEQAHWFAELGFTVVWLPPPTDSVSDEGYLPRDLYNLNSKYGTEDELRDAVRTLQAHGLKVLGDAVLNHRCAHEQDEKGVWNKFGGRLAWDQRAIVSDDPNFRGRGHKSTGDLFHAAPNIDHQQDFVRRDICEWLCWLRCNIGYDGWRLDFVRGFTGDAVADYMGASMPTFAVGEYWDTLQYNWEGVPEHNQDGHRQRIVNWIKGARGRATAFDVTTKGILHAVFERCEYWRLTKDGKAPGLLGWWPSRAVTFLENHDTGSTQGHWRFPHHGLEQGYAYILSHPGTPSVFYDHLHEERLRAVVQRLIAFRKRTGIHCRSQLTIIKAERDVYLAQVDDAVLLKMGPGSAAVDEGAWALSEAGTNWALYEKL